MKIGIASGAFDLLHAGHVLFLKECKKQCDELIVALHVDPSLENVNKHTPIQSVFERKVQLDACKYVDRISLYQTNQDLEDMLRHMRIDIRFNGSDHESLDLSSRDIVCQEEGIDIIYIDRNHRFSTSELRERIKNVKS